MTDTPKERHLKVVKDIQDKEDKTAFKLIDGGKSLPTTTVTKLLKKYVVYRIRGNSITVREIVGTINEIGTFKVFVFKSDLGSAWCKLSDLRATPEAAVKYMQRYLTSQLRKLERETVTVKRAIRRLKVCKSVKVAPFK